MQVYALNSQGERVFVEDAEKSCPYFCIECGQELYARGGEATVLHFYHAHPKIACTQHKKSLRHIQLQQFICKKWLGCEEEVRFSTINRIADLFVPSERLVFEVQCSFIPKQEVLERVRDYRSEGCEVIWILDEGRFGKRKVTAAEYALLGLPHYFAHDFVISDHLDIVANGLRKRRIFSCPIDITTLKRRKPEILETPVHSFSVRMNFWPLHFQGDAIDRKEEVMALCANYEPKSEKKQPLATSIIQFFRSLWYMLLSHS